MLLSAQVDTRKAPHLRRNMVIHGKAPPPSSTPPEAEAEANPSPAAAEPSVIPATPPASPAASAEPVTPPRTPQGAEKAREEPWFLEGDAATRGPPPLIPRAARRKRQRGAPPPEPPPQRRRRQPPQSSQKRCTLANCTVRKPQSLEEFIGRDGGVRDTCRTCRNKQAVRDRRRREKAGREVKELWLTLIGLLESGGNTTEVLEALAKRRNARRHLTAADIQRLEELGFSVDQMKLQPREKTIPPPPEASASPPATSQDEALAAMAVVSLGADRDDMMGQLGDDRMGQLLQEVLQLPPEKVREFLNIMHARCEHLVEHEGREKRYATR